MKAARHPKLGQHFLRDAVICRRIAGSLAIEPDELLVEIGPGRGDMTRLLAQHTQRLTAIEIDPVLAAALRVEFKDQGSVEILERDILHVSLDDLCRRRGAERCCVFGNLPYFITSPILQHLFAARASIRRMTLLVQLEVARRLTAMTGTRDHGYLSVFVQCASRPRILFEVSPGAFSPPPKVHSALVDFEMSSQFPQWDQDTHDAFLLFAQRCFARKRKSLSNNLSPFYPRARVQELIESLGFTPSVRAEQLGVADLARVLSALREKPQM